MSPQLAVALICSGFALLGLFVWLKLIGR